jgi:hypothetical protein
MITMVIIKDKNNSMTATITGVIMANGPGISTP